MLPNKKKIVSDIDYKSKERVLDRKPPLYILKEGEGVFVTSENQYYKKINGKLVPIGGTANTNITNSNITVVQQPETSIDTINFPIDYLIEFTSNSYIECQKQYNDVLVSDSIDISNYQIRGINAMVTFILDSSYYKFPESFYGVSITPIAYDLADIDQMSRYYYKIAFKINSSQKLCLRLTQCKYNINTNQDLEISTIEYEGAYHIPKSIYDIYRVGNLKAIISGGIICEA